MEEACLALAELAWGHRENQEVICAAGAVSPLVRILRSRRMPAQVKAAKALEAIADHNAAIQTRFLKRSATKHLLWLLKVTTSWTTVAQFTLLSVVETPAGFPSDNVQNIH